MLSQITQLEHLIAAGTLQNEVDLQTITFVLEHLLTPSTQHAEKNLQLIAWAAEELPHITQPISTLWFVGEHAIDLEGADAQQLSTHEWVVAGDFRRLRRLIFALSIFRVLRTRMNAFEIDSSSATESQFLSPLAMASGIALSQLRSHFHTPELFAQLRSAFAFAKCKLHVQHFDSTLPSASAREFWHQILRTLAELQADDREICVWSAPLWVTDLLSPYVREVRPLLSHWAKQNTQLQTMSAQLDSGDEDTAYWVAELFCRYDPQVAVERESNEYDAGFLSIADTHGTPLARVFDSAKLDAQWFDARLADLAPSKTRPIVLVVDEAQVDTEYALNRLLSEVSAKFTAVYVCANAHGFGEAPSVISPRLLQTLQEQKLLLTANAHPADVDLTTWGIPDQSYLPLFSATNFALPFALVEEFRLRQTPLLQAFSQGDFSHVAVSQNLWLNDTTQSFDRRRAHIRHALALWQDLLQLITPSTPEPETPSREPLLPSRFRLRV